MDDTSDITNSIAMQAAYFQKASLEAQLVSRHNDVFGALLRGFQSVLLPVEEKQSRRFIFMLMREPDSTLFALH